MKDAFEKLIRESDKAVPVPESIAKYAAALVAGTHEITSLTIRPKRTWVGLTEAEVESLCLSVGAEPLEVRFIEAKLKEKNT